MWKASVTGVVIAAVVAVACGGDSNGFHLPVRPTPTPASAAPPPPVVVTQPTDVRAIAVGEDITEDINISHQNVRDQRPLGDSVPFLRAHRSGEWNTDRDGDVGSGRDRQPAASQDGADRDSTCAARVVASRGAIGCGQRAHLQPGRRPGGHRQRYGRAVHADHENRMKGHPWLRVRGARLEVGIRPGRNRDEATTDYTGYTD